MACTLLMSLTAAAACGTSPQTAPPPAATTSAAPSPTTDPRVELASMVTAAGLPPKDLGVTAAKSQETIGKLAMPCDAPLAAENVAGHSWTFSGADPAVISNSVFAYYPELGRAVVDQVRPSLTTCKNWTWAGIWDMAVVGAFPVDQPIGADNALAYCHHGTVLNGAAKGNQVYLCDAVISRGHLVAQVGTVELTLTAAQNDVKKALPLLGAALVRAVAAP